MRPKQQTITLINGTKAGLFPTLPAEYWKAGHRHFLFAKGSGFVMVAAMIEYEHHGNNSETHKGDCRGEQIPSD